MIRINRVLELISEKTVIDIGSDHAYLLINGVNNNKIDSGLVVEIADGPLENALDNIKKNNLSKQIDVIKSDGLISVDKGVIDEYQAICICGMGGVLISDILLSSIEKITNQTLYLQANNNIDKLRLFLMNNKYHIIDECLVEENDIIYEIIVAKRKDESIQYTDIELKFGPKILLNKNNLFIAKYRQELGYLDNLIKSLEKQNKVNDKLNKEYEMIKEQLCNYVK